MSHVRRFTIGATAPFDDFRRCVRALVGDGVPPESAILDAGPCEQLFPDDGARDAKPLALPRRVIELTRLVSCHRDGERFQLLYKLIWRVERGERELLQFHSDPLVRRLRMMEKSVQRDIHKMHAFVRFRRVDVEGGADRFVAWFEPDHDILREATPFFVNRFRSMSWTILTPRGSVHWNRENLTFGPPATRSDAPSADALEESWRSYYESIFNPARLNSTAMRAEMPKKFWRNLPEAASLSGLVRSAPARVKEMIDREPAAAMKRNPTKAVEVMMQEAPKSLADLNRLIDAAGPLVPGATQPVFGEGPVGGVLAFVGEQPGDQEDLQGRPFVGPAGQLLMQAMREAGIAREETYLTNAVKHFKFEMRGKRRIHQKPTMGEVKHYRWWLMKELELVQPSFVVALGATAASALVGYAVAVGQNRGKTEFEGRPGYITVHPSYLLRIGEEDARRAAYNQFVFDLRTIRAHAAQ